MPKSVKPIPEGHHSLTPALTMKDSRKAIEFYKKAFGAKLTGGVFEMPDGRVGHAELMIGDSPIMLNDEFPDMGCAAPKGGAVSSSLYLYVPDCDATFKAAVAAGAKSVMPVADQFWGDRSGSIQDPFGHRWTIATRKENLSEDEMRQRGQEFFAAHAK